MLDERGHLAWIHRSSRRIPSADHRPAPIGGFRRGPPCDAPPIDPGRRPRTGIHPRPSVDPALDSTPVPAFKAAYLIHGDDHGRLAERRARLRALAEQDGGVNGAEVFEGEES